MIMEVFTNSIKLLPISEEFFKYFCRNLLKRMKKPIRDKSNYYLLLFDKKPKFHII